MNKISEDEVFEYYQNGLPDDFNLDKTKVVRRGRGNNNESPLTIQISIKFEFDLINQIKEMAEKNGLPYQTFMKQILKDYLKRPSISDDLNEIKQKLDLLETKLIK